MIGHAYRKAQSYGFAGMLMVAAGKRGLGAGGVACMILGQHRHGVPCGSSVWVSEDQPQGDSRPR
jgi:hypothetical protein